MSIVLEKVVGRNNQLFADIKKDISISLGQVREFVTTVTQKKKSQRGFKSTCEQIDSFVGGANKAFEIVHRRLWAEGGLTDMCKSIDYTVEVDVEFGGAAADRLCRAAQNIEKYLAHFNKAVVRGETAAAAVSIQKYRPKLVELIDKAKRLNIGAEEAVRKYLASDRFAHALLAPDSTIDIVKGDLAGTTAEKRRFLEQIQERAAALGANVIIDDDAAPFIEHEDGKVTGLIDDDDEESPTRVEESFVVKKKKKRHSSRSDASNDDDDADDDDSDSSDEEKNGDPEASDDDDDDDGTATSEGGALFDGAIKEINKKILKEVAANAYVKGGRTLRNTNRLQYYSDFVTQNPEYQVDEYRTSAPKPKSDVRGEEAREYDSEISESDDDDDDGARRVANDATDEIEAQMKAIEKERRRAAAKQAAKESEEKTGESIKKRKSEFTCEEGETAVVATSAPPAPPQTSLAVDVAKRIKVKKEKASADDDEDEVRAAASKSKPEKKPKTPPPAAVAVARPARILMCADDDT